MKLKNIALSPIINWLIIHDFRFVEGQNGYLQTCSHWRVMCSECFGQPVPDRRCGYAEAPSPTFVVVPATANAAGRPMKERTTTFWCRHQSGVGHLWDHLLRWDMYGGNRPHCALPAHILSDVRLPVSADDEKLGWWLQWYRRSLLMFISKGKLSNKRLCSSSMTSNVEIYLETIVSAVPIILVVIAQTLTMCEPRTVYPQFTRVAGTRWQ